MAAIAQRVHEESHPLRQLDFIFQEMFSPGVDRMLAVAEDFCRDSEELQRTDSLLERDQFQRRSLLRIHYFSCVELPSLRRQRTLELGFHSRIAAGWQ
ncbi:MAG: hypothetical protein HZB55_07700 [Deltaproteobacteria bacterium]|nr:hypothetical protein [Deltaproteobacteria bacterium]